MNIELSRKKILIVDDNLVNIRVIGEALRIKYEIVFAVNGVSALSIIKSKDAPDLIITDFNMPEMDGCQLVKAIRVMEKEKGGRLPVICLTADYEKETLKKCFKAGMDECLSRSVDTSVIEKKVSEFLGKTGKKKIDSERNSNISALNKNAPFNLDSLRIKLGNDDLKVKKMLKWAIKDTELQITNIISAFKNGMIEQIVESAHKARSSAIHLEAVILVDAFQNIEDFAAGRKSDLILEQTKKATSCLDSIREYINENEIF